MKIGIFGGTFNPIHNGHIKIAKKIIKETNIEKVVFMPNAIPPHKNDEEIADSADRYYMIQKAIERYKNMEVSDYEIRKKGVSYTVETLRFLNKKYDDEFYWIIGADMLLSFNEWYKHDEILELAGLITVNRPGNGNKEYGKKIDEYVKKYNAKIQNIIIEPIDLSSTEIREKIKQGKDVKPLVPYSVWMYINDNNLYGAK